jgi:Protein of unknown function (DUF3567)
MQLLYNSDSFVVLLIDAGTPDDGVAPHSGLEIVDKFARKGIFIEGAVAQGFSDGVKALIESGPGPEAVDDYIAGYTALAQQTVHLH